MSGVERQRHALRRRAGVTLAEVLVSIAVMSVLMVAALNTLGASARSYAQLNQLAKGDLLAQDLLDEIVAQPYADGASVTIGTELDELAVTRTDFDDVDDYHNWSASPPERSDGTAIADLTDWTRSVKVQFVCSADVDQVSRVDAGFKRITVSVSFQGKPVASILGIRASGADASLTVDDAVK